MKIKTGSLYRVKYTIRGLEKGFDRHGVLTDFTTGMLFFKAPEATEYFTALRAGTFLKLISAKNHLPAHERQSCDHDNPERENIYNYRSFSDLAPDEILEIIDMANRRVKQADIKTKFNISRKTFDKVVKLEELPQ